MIDEPEDIKKLSEKIEKLKQNTGEPKIENDINNYNKGMQIVIEMVSGVIVGAGIGYIFDEIFDFKNVLLLSFTVLGGFAGMLNVSHYLKNIQKK